MSNLRKITGTGFLTLDIIVNGSIKTPPRLQAGGSFGNVLTILSFLDFETYPISRLADNKFTELLLDDISSWNVSTDLIYKDEKASTPVIIHRILKTIDGKAKHRFEFRNPNNGKRLPSYRPFLSKMVESIEDLVPEANVYYFDRANRGSIELAKVAKAKGAIVYFEPSGYGDANHFHESVDIADIIKFSNQRFSDYRGRYPRPNATLEIETKGEAGLSYRFRSDTWVDLAPKIVDNVLDTAGAGDWCSAGIIRAICSNGPLNEQSVLEIESALQDGQAFGAVNCLFDGARGAMYHLESKEFLSLVDSVLRNDSKIDFMPTAKFGNSYTHKDLKKLLDLAL